MTMSRGRKSNITRLPAEQRAHIELLLREDRHTLKEMLDAVRARFPEADVSRSGLHRYQSSLSELTARMREIDRAAAALVGELGEGVGEKAGALLAQAVTTLATNAALRAQENEDITIDEVRKLAQAAKLAMDARRISLAEREQIEEGARKRLLIEQQARLSDTVKAGGLSQEFADTLRKKVLGCE